MVPPGGPAEGGGVRSAPARSGPGAVVPPPPGVRAAPLPLHRRPARKWREGPLPAEPRCSRERCPWRSPARGGGETARRERDSSVSRGLAPSPAPSEAPRAPHRPLRPPTGPHRLPPHTPQTPHRARRAPTACLAWEGRQPSPACALLPGGGEGGQRGRGIPTGDPVDARVCAVPRQTAAPFCQAAPPTAPPHCRDRLPAILPHGFSTSRRPPLWAPTPLAYLVATGKGLTQTPFLP